MQELTYQILCVAALSPKNKKSKAEISESAEIDTNKNKRKVLFCVQAG